MKVIKTIKREDGREEDIIINVCPICGEEMDETYTSRDYCYKCWKEINGPREKYKLDKLN